MAIFFKALDYTVRPTGTVMSFTWSGQNNHLERVKAANRLATLLDSVPLSTSITLVAHSHGANVAFIASQKLIRRHIDKIYTLGAPIDCTRCQPNMKIINTLYNIFSFGDQVQTVSGYFERTLPPHPQSTNIRLMLNGTNPNHAHLHDTIVARWLIKIPQLIAQGNKKGDPEMPPFITLELFDSTQPYCHVDQTLPKLLEDEKQAYAILAAQMLPRTKHPDYSAPS